MKTAPASIFRPPTTHVLLFAPRFVDPVVLGDKRQTVRGRRKRAIHAGDVLSLRMWWAEPYRSKQVEIRRAVCAAAEPVAIRCGRQSWQVAVEVAGVRLEPWQLDVFARADGFSGVEDFRAWRVEHCPPSFEGILIRWEV